MGKYKVKFNLTYDNVVGKTKGESVGSKDMDFEGSASVNFFFSTSLPGDHKVEAILMDDNGKELGKKSGTVTVKGSAPVPTASHDSKTDDDDSDHGADDKH